MPSTELPSSLTAPPSSPPLPVELLAQIIDEAAGDHDDLDYTTLRHLCLTSRSILPFARRALYRDITVTVNDYHPKPRPVFRGDDPLEEERFLISSDSDALEETLARAPHLSQLVTGFSLWYDTKLSALELPPHLTGCFLRICPNVITFHLPEAYVKEAETVVAELSSGVLNLTQLEINTTSNIDTLLSHLPLLQHLHIRNYDDNFSFEAPNFPFQLKSLRLGARRTPGAEDLLEELLRCSEKSLGHLHLPLSTAANSSLRLPQFASLSHLTLWTDYDERDVDYPKELSDALPKCTSLRYLRLAIMVVPTTVTDRLPLQVSAIQFDVAPQRKHAGALFSDGSRGALRQVIMQDSGDEGWEALGAEHGWQVDRFRRKVIFVR